jgi:hypothetical protein
MGLLWYGAAWVGALRYGFRRRVLLSHRIDRTLIGGGTGVERDAFS